MKKQLLATAIAGMFAVPAIAQVTVSGNLDVTATRSNKVEEVAASGTTAYRNTETSNTGGGNGISGTASSWVTPQLVFEAKEDLGGGMTATARFSQSIAAETFAARDRYVEVGGGFGSVRLGRFNPFIGGLDSYSGAGTSNSPGDLDQMATGSVKLFGSGITGGSFGRQDGQVQFTSPTFSGFNVVVGYGSNSTDDTANTNRLSENKMQSLGVQYKAGPLTVAAAMGERKVKTAATTGTKGRAFFFNATQNATATQDTAANSTVGDSIGGTTGYTLTQGAFPTGNILGVITSAGAIAGAQFDAKHEFDWLGASYNLGPATVMVSHSRRKTTSNSSTSGSATSTLNDAKVNSIGLMVPLGATTLRVSTYAGKDERGTGNTDDAKLEGNQISATYNLSKRTFIYAVTGDSEVKRDGSSSTIYTRKEKGNSIGVVHTF